jgi:hypothetical protein
MSHRSPEAGFGLAEAIVALAIIALGLPTIYRAMADAYHASASVRTHEAALSLARTHLDTLGANDTIEEGTNEGSYDNGMLWRLTCSTLAGKDNGANNAPLAYWVVLEVFDRNQKQLLKLETVKLASQTQ